MKTEIRNNCWDVMGCGFGPGGAEGMRCPAADEVRLHRIHGGINGGRACWAVAGTFCHKDPGVKFSKKMETCIECPFYRRVHVEEPEVKSHQELLLRASPVR